MSSEWTVSIPVSWYVPVTNTTSLNLFRKEIVSWCTRTGIAGRSVAEKAVSRLNPAHYMMTLFPKVDPLQPTLSKLYEMNAAIIVGGYIMDDVLETYTLEALVELDAFFRSTEAWLSQLQPSEYPKIEGIVEQLQEITVPFSRAVVCMFTDYFNQCCLALSKIDEISPSNVRHYRKRLSASVTAYLEMAMEKRQDTAVKLDEKEFLWQRSADNLGFPVLMFIEVFSNLLQEAELAKIPTTIFHYFHMYSNLFAHVLNDLNSFHRDIDTDHNNLIKLWIQNGLANDFEDAAKKVVQFLSSAIIRMYKAFAECSKQFPNCPALERFLESIGYSFNGWIVVHTTTVERYRLSPYQISLTIVQQDKQDEWLKNESNFGKRCVQLFEELMKEREKKMIEIYGLSN